MDAMLQVTFESYLFSTTGVTWYHWIFYILLNLNIIFAFSDCCSLLVHNINLIKFKLLFIYLYFDRTYFIHCFLEKTFVFFIDFKLQLFLLNLPNYGTNHSQFLLYIVELVYFRTIISIHHIYPAFFFLELFNLVKRKSMKDKFIH